MTAPPAAGASIFRKVALDRLSSPEQLDQLVTGMPFRPWLVLGPLVVLAAGVVAWSWFGTVPTIVSGSALLTNTSGLSDVEAKGAGRLAGFSLHVGDMVTEGQVLGHIVQPELADRIAREQARLHEMVALDEEQDGARGADDHAADQAATQQKATLGLQVDVARDRAANLRTRLATQTRLLADGLVTAQQVTATRNEIDAADVQVESLRNELRQVDLHRNTRARASRGDAASSRIRISELRRAIDSMLAQQSESSQVTASSGGRVVEVLSANGQTVASGQDIVIIEHAARPQEKDEHPLTVRAYISIADGKKITAGMEARVVPSTVVREEHGYLLGTVVNVSPYPVTPAGMQLALQNASLVRSILDRGAAVEVGIRLEPAATPTGYRWSTERGPDTLLATGTPANADIVVRRQRPIELAMPFVRRLLEGRS